MTLKEAERLAKKEMRKHELNKIYEFRFINNPLTFGECMGEPEWYIALSRPLVKLNKKYDRILMPLPKLAEDFLGEALAVSKKDTIIHFYNFLHEKEFEKAEQMIKKACVKAKKKYKILKFVKCGQHSPGTYRICLDFKIV